MYVDSNLIVSGGVNAAGVVTYQTVTGASAVLSTNTVDLSQNRDIGTGRDVFLRAEVGTAFAGITGLDIEAITADDAALSSNVVTIGKVSGVPVASLTAGARVAVKLSAIPMNTTGKRYLGARFTPAGTGTAGTLIADFGIEEQEFNTYPSGFSVI